MVHQPILLQVIDDLKHEVKELRNENASLKLEKEHFKREMQFSLGHYSGDGIFQSIFENSPLGNKIINSDFEILRANNAIVHLFGYPLEEILGHKILDFVPEEYHDEWRSLQKELWQHHIPFFSLDTCIRRRDGSLVFCEVTSILFPQPSELLGYTIIEDRTERLAVQKQKDEFIGKVSHELRTPITSIKAYTQILMRSLKLTEDSVDLVYLKRMNMQITQLESLIKDLFDVTRAESGKLVLNPTWFEADILVRDLVNDLQLIIPSHSLELINVQKTTIFADKARIIQVLNNLITNAVKYSPGAERIEVSLYKKDGFMVVQVDDFGIGIAPEDMSNIFLKFHQVDHSGHNAGLGLGLYISNEIIKKSGGRLWLESNKGKGTSFYFSLPLHV